MTQEEFDALVDALCGLCSDAYGQGSRRHGLDISYGDVEQMLTKHGIKPTIEN